MPTWGFCYWCRSTSSNPGKCALTEETEPGGSAQRSSLATSSRAIALRALAPGMHQESSGLNQTNVSVAAEIWGTSWGCWVGLHFRNASPFGVICTWVHVTTFFRSAFQNVGSLGLKLSHGTCGSGCSLDFLASHTEKSSGWDLPSFGWREMEISIQERVKLLL